MLSQDIKLADDMVFYNLVKDIHTGETAYNYAKQICTNNSIEKYIRERNYPDTSYIVSKDDIEKMQIMAFFASDACSAYDRDTFIHLGGYGGYNVMMNEDQLYSKILLDAGYKKKYCADAIVEHSHKYTLKQVYKRYYEVGLFYSEVGLFDTYKSANTGFKLALYVLCQAVKHLDIPAILRWLPDMAARYLGMKFGKIAGKNNTSNR
jgi:rhamnosyltransferase